MNFSNQNIFLYSDLTTYYLNLAKSLAAVDSAIFIAKSAASFVFNSLLYDFFFISKYFLTFNWAEIDRSTSTYITGAKLDTN